MQATGHQIKQITGKSTKRDNRRHRRPGWCTRQTDRRQTKALLNAPAY